MKNAPHLTTGFTDADFARQVNLTAAGMAAWAAGGPFGTKCSGCAHLGYWKKRTNAAGETISMTHRKRACGKFFELTGKHGPAIEGNPESCRYYEPHKS